jgi:hypothetical protein
VSVRVPGANGEYRLPLITESEPEVEVGQQVGGGCGCH